MSFRTGIGYDVHRLVPGRALMLGGVHVPYERGLLGHSDGDAVIHAVCDALLGAAALGDIGELFPDHDPAHKDADSRQFLREVGRRVADAGYVPANVDVIVHAEQPNLKSYKAQIRQSLADLLGLPLTCVGVKATTNEGLDAIGRGEAIACWAAVLLRPSDPASRNTG